MHILLLLSLEDGTKIDAVMQDIQFHPVSDKILHVDFFQLHPGKEINMIIPVKIEGTAPGVKIKVAYFLEIRENLRLELFLKIFQIFLRLIFLN